MLNRIIQSQIINDLKPGHVTGLFGARRTGKTVLMNQIKGQLDNNKILMVHGEDLDTAEVLASQRSRVLKNFVTGYDYLFIDEAQKIPGIGNNLKLMVDTIPEICIFVTGSSAFDLKQKIGEPLTGRSRFFNLFPFSYSELNEDFITTRKSIHEKLIYGTYPMVFLEQNFNEKRHLLEEIKNGYLLKDILELDNLKNSLFILNLLRLIAFQIGNDISYNELSRNLKTTVKTVQRYLEILEKTFIIFNLNGFSRNLRKEYSKTPRYYFWDTGIRNAIISNFNSIYLRDDKGKLWENYCISERIKKITYARQYVNFYFWRTYDQQEIDLIEEENGKLSAFEFKFVDEEARIPKAFANAYPNARFKTINTYNFQEFLSE